MENQVWIIVAIFLLGAGSICGFFITKKPGFGRFTTSVLLILLVITISALLYASGNLNEQVMGNVLFAVFGFAGGLFTSKNSPE